MPRLRLAVAVVAVAAVACTGRAAIDSARQRRDAERRTMDEQLDRLEERLLADQARVHFWQQMRERHESVSAVACVNLGRHAEGIALLDEKQREKRDALARKNRVATRVVSGSKSTQ